MATTTVYLLAISKRRFTISGVVSSAATESQKNNRTKQSRYGQSPEDRDIPKRLRSTSNLKARLGIQILGFVMSRSPGGLRD